MSDRHTYASYLRIEELLDCQQMQSSSHDEMLFIVIHQVNELWFKLILHEMHGAMAALDRGQALTAYKMLERVAKIEATMVTSWDVLQTLTPDKYQEFRPIVGREGGSGFQSLQYRALEFLLGVKHRHRTFRAADGGTASVDVIDVHKGAGAEHRKTLEPAVARPRALRCGAPSAGPALSGSRHLAGSRLRPTLTSATRRCWRPGSRSTRPPTTGWTSTCWGRSWSTWRTTSGAGGSGT